MIVIERELDRIGRRYELQNPCPFFPVTSFILPIDFLAFQPEGFLFAPEGKKGVNVLC